jgi:hypothetical protein
MGTDEVQKLKQGVSVRLSGGRPEGAGGHASRVPRAGPGAQDADCVSQGGRQGGGVKHCGGIS